MEKYNIGVVGYGNLGKALVKRLSISRNMRASVIFTRRDPREIGNTFRAETDSFSYISMYEGKLDALALTVGSASDLVPVALSLCGKFNLIDAYDDHKRMRDYARLLNVKAEESGKLAFYACGWDPGLMSLARGLFESVLPFGKGISFWGKGVSQGHTQAVKEIEGVKDALQYTIPIKRFETRAGRGLITETLPENLHRRYVLVSAADDADKERIRKTITDMPDYFDLYETKVVFCTGKKIERLKKNKEHKGRVIRVCEETGSILEFRVETQSNPDLTANIMAAYLPALIRMQKEGEKGARNVFEIPFDRLVDDNIKFV